MYSLVFNLRFGGKNILQKILVDDSIVLVFFEDKKSIYIKEVDKIYSINSETQHLSSIDFSNFQKQNDNISKRIGFLNFTKESNPGNIFEFESYLYHYFNQDNTFNCIIKTICDIDFIDTSYSDYFNFNMKNQLMSVSFDKNEILAYNKTEINFNQINQTVETELISIEKIKIPRELLEIRNYKIIENERNLY
ncbi:hypothetical protein [Flavobacterium sp. YJ01]|uniref:hypothetical protein n=1 Tax=unclassified Flavobacterium TaxID=196869 RepID=UPI0023E42765|nr:hypothetical protein [Flavobacterium sp. YJ01]WET00489.1 hypothetical protein P0R33_11975 [Flavobacterium sp. YJ01]